MNSLQRGNDSYFDDLDLARILHEATEWPARSTGAGFLSDQRVQQVQTIEWARELKACSFVDYRRSLGLKGQIHAPNWDDHYIDDNFAVPHSFDEWTSDKLVAKAAETLYRNIENLELYVSSIALAELFDCLILYRLDYSSRIRYQNPKIRACGLGIPR